MERDFHRYLLKLDPDDRNNSLLTFLHLLDDEELSDLVQMSQREQANRGKRASGSSAVKRPESAAHNRSAATGRDMFKRVRLSVDTSTPIRAVVTSNPMRQMKLQCFPVAQSTKPKDLLSDLVRGQQPVTAGQNSENAEKFVTDTPPDEEEKWDDELDAIVAAYDADGQDRQSDSVTAADAKQADPASADTIATGNFVTGKYKKKSISRNGKEALITGLDSDGDHVMDAN